MLTVFEPVARRFFGVSRQGLELLRSQDIVVAILAHARLPTKRPLVGYISEWSMPTYPLRAGHEVVLIARRWVLLV